MSTLAYTDEYRKSQTGALRALKDFGLITSEHAAQVLSYLNSGEAQDLNKDGYATTAYRYLVDNRLLDETKLIDYIVEHGIVQLVAPRFVKMDPSFSLKYDIQLIRATLTCPIYQDKKLVTLFSPYAFNPYVAELWQKKFPDCQLQWYYCLYIDFLKMLDTLKPKKSI